MDSVPRVLCPICEKTFKNKKQLGKHKINIHGITVAKEGSKSINCSVKECEYKCNTLREYRGHLKDVHKEHIEEETLKFNTKEEFDHWLAQEERHTKSHFVLARGEVKYADYSIIYFDCNRSGTYKPHGKGKRQLKAQGSAKIGFHCTAGLKLKISPSHVDVLYFKTHFGHDHLCHMPLEKEVKHEIAGKLLQGVTEKRVLQDVRLTLDSDLKRQHLLNRKDIGNIKRDFGIQLDSRGSVFQSDELSVESWVQDMKENVLLYKRQNKQHSVLDEKDFFLVIMTPFQEQMLNSFGSDRICIDSTHAIGGYGFELASVIVIDEYEEGTPVAFCISSTISKKTMSVFLNCIKEKVPHLKANIFMSDDTAIFYNAWERTFGPCQSRLLCAWHVDRAWQVHLNKVKKEKRQEVYKNLKTLLYELDEQTFHGMLTNLLTELQEDEDTIEFGNYFQKNYCNHIDTWAYCFRKGARINTNMHVEAFHKVLKHAYLQGEKTRRLDKCLQELIKFITDKQFDQMIKSQKGKITQKMSDNYKRHHTALSSNMEIMHLSDISWEIIYSEKKYLVTKKHNCDKSCLTDFSSDDNIHS